jgi:hypothetical protein
MSRVLCGVVALAGLIGCAPIHPPEPAGDHPASPQAIQAENAQLSDVLTVDEKNLPQMPREMRRGMMHPGHGQMNGEMGGSHPAGTDESVRYTCTMHPDVITKSPGACPKCGMQLVPKGGADDE